MEMDSIKAGNSSAAGVLAATITVFVVWFRTVVVDLFTVCC
jgi:hypothetical protein